MQAKCFQHPPHTHTPPQTANHGRAPIHAHNLDLQFCLEIGTQLELKENQFSVFSSCILFATILTLIYCMCDTQSPVFTCSLHVIIFWYNHNLHISPPWTAEIFILCKCPVSSQYAAHEWLPVHHCSGFIEHIRKQSWAIWGKKCLCRII